MKKDGRYNVSGLPEAQFEPGSRGRVLRNALGIVRVRDMQLDGLPVKAGPRQVTVRVVDVFGFESEVVEKIPDSNGKPEGG